MTMAGSALVRSLGEAVPRIAQDAFLADGVVVIGDVAIGPESSIWYGSVLRGDVGAIRIGARSNVQDLSMLHMSLGRTDAVIGDEVTVGHRVVIHGARIGDGALIGIGAILLDGVQIGEEALVAAGAVLTPGTVVPPRTLVIGHPGKVVRDLSDREARQGRELAARYLERAREHTQLGQAPRD
jgi:carbonic anhydrase/acetyltransferase-like protein (isoleucine patch superfamily)